MEERGGEDWTDEKKAEYEKKVTGKILAAAWRGSKFEIQSVLRDVCDQVLGDKTIKLDKRIERAHALVLAGNIYSKVRQTLHELRPPQDTQCSHIGLQAERDAEEEGDYMAFEQLMAEAMQKKGKEEKKRKHHKSRSGEHLDEPESA